VTNVTLCSILWNRNLAHNRIRGTIPPTIDSAINLRGLYVSDETPLKSKCAEFLSFFHCRNLSHNALSGELPANFHMMELEFLYVAKKQLVLQASKILTVILPPINRDLRNNTLRGALPYSFGHSVVSLCAFDSPLQAAWIPPLTLY
jgi:hypothetical protein